MRSGRLAVVVAVILLGSGCLWRSYEKIMSVHVQVMASVAAKIVGNAQAGVRPSASDVTELTYPLQRARQFARQYEDHRDRDSYRLFLQMVERYQAMVEAIDAARGDRARWEALEPALSAQLAAVEESASRVRAALERDT